MILQYDSIGSAMQKVLRDIRIQDMSLKNDLIEWVADALDILNTTHQLFPQNKELEIKNYGALLPCGIKSIQAVEYNGCRVRYGESSGGRIEFNDVLPTRDYLKYWIVKPLEIVPNEYHQIGMNYIQASIQQLEAVTSYDVYEDLYYYTQDRSLETNIEKGKIKIHYLGTKVDDKGYPLVPRNMLLKEAVVDYVDYKLTRAGYKDGRWDVLYQKWKESSGQAINDIEFPSPERTQSLMDSTLGLIKPSYYDEFEV